MKGKNEQMKVLAVANCVAFGATIVVNVLANLGVINGKTTGEISHKYPNLFVPEDFTFAIWGVIYALLIVFCLYQVIVAFYRPIETEFLEKISFYFILSSLANILWLFAWHYESLGLSVFLMAVLLLSLIQIYQALRIQYIKQRSKVYSYCVQLPISVYLGWISIAAISNVAAFLVSIGWNRWGLSEVFWTVLMMGVGILLGTIMIFVREDIYYALVIVWSLIGIFVKQMAMKPVSQLILWTALLGIIVLGINSILVFGKWRTKKARRKS